MGLRCKRCGSGEQTRNGFMRGKQRYRCKGCGLNFTDSPPRGMPFQLKVTAVLLYVSGLSMMNGGAVHHAGRVHAQRDGLDRAVRQGACAKARTRGPSFGRRARRDVALSEKRPARSGCGKLGIVLQGDWLAGNAAVVTAPRWSGCSPASSAGTRAFTALMTGRPTKRRSRRAASTSARIRRMRSSATLDRAAIKRQRHWLARFRRRSIVVSKARRMADASIALFARFGGNNRSADLAAMLA